MNGIKIAVLIISLVACQVIFAQYNGGYGDGGGIKGLYSHLFPSNAVFNGSYGDGGAQKMIASSISPGLCNNGGYGDGMEAGGYAGSVFGSGYYLNGAYGNGDAMKSSGIQSINQQSNFCSGGYGDGIGLRNVQSSVATYAYCSGGYGDGQFVEESPQQFLGYYIWTGYSDSSWYRSSNWTHDVVPDSNSLVVVPGGRLFYPSLYSALSINKPDTGQVRWRRLDLMDGSYFSTNNEVFVKGILNISGNFHHKSVNANSFQLFPTGSVLVKDGGILLLAP